MVAWMPDNSSAGKSSFRRFNTCFIIALRGSEWG